MANLSRLKELIAELLDVIEYIEAENVRDNAEIKAARQQSEGYKYQLDLVNKQLEDLSTTE